METKKSPSIVSTTRTREDDDHLPLSEQTNRPSDIPIQTQTINAWHPILDPNWVIFTYLALAAIMIPFGKLLTCFVPWNSSFFADLWQLLRVYHFDFLFFCVF
mmetsp:Transcript_9732/g.20171  ORF Transcript_9732/g.20171 Transcript_9732/m.20171 type:complete len:103 (+) Transcript_9732:135-443(+)